MGSGLKIDISIFDKIGIIIRALVKPRKPLESGDGAVTFTIPVIGAVTIYVINKEKAE